MEQVVEAVDHRRGHFREAPGSPRRPVARAGRRNGLRTGSWRRSGGVHGRNVGFVAEITGARPAREPTLRSRVFQCTARWHRPASTLVPDGAFHEPIPTRTSPARRPAVHHRRRTRNDTDLPRGHRPAALRGVRPARQSDAAKRSSSATSRAMRRSRRANDVGVVLESATWRANPDWAAKLGYDAGALRGLHRKSIAQLLGIRARFETPRTPIVDQRQSRPARRRLPSRRADERRRSARRITRRRCARSPRPTPTWSRRSR